MDLPPGWQWRLDGEVVPGSARATVQVRGLVITIPGQAQRYVLSNASNGLPERAHIRGSFHTGSSREYPVIVVDTEAELKELLSDSAVFRITLGRIPLPRIRCKAYWPPSDRAVAVMLDRAYQILRQSRGDFSLLSSITFAEIEGLDLRAMWEPITDGHPASRDIQWPWATT